MKRIYRSRASRRPRFLRRAIAWVLLPIGASVLFASFSTLTHAQIDKNVQKQEDQLIREFTPPAAPPPAPVYQPAPQPAAPAPAEPEPAPAPDSSAPASSAPSAPAAPAPAASSPSRSEPERQPSESPKPTNQPTSQYVLEFNRSPVVGNRLRLQGTYAESRIGFTRPRNWDLKTTKALIRFQHSPALVASKSNLTVRVNNTSVGSVPLNRKESQVGQLLVNIPSNLIQNYNELTVVAQQQNKADGCSDPADQTLWSEVLPDSKLLFDFQPKPIALSFSQYPYPFFDDLSLDATQITYLLPTQTSDAWLTAAAQFQAGIGRLADFRPIETQTARSLTEVRNDRRLVMIGTPTEQPALKSLKLPYKLNGNQFVDGSKTALPDDVGLLMLATTPNNGTPVLVITGNGADGVAKAAQFLLQSEPRKLADTSAVLVTQLAEVPSPSPRQWPRYLPDRNSFQLSDLKGTGNQPLKDVTVRGSYAPPVEFDFRALPDDRFERGSTMTLYYSHGPQINPRLSTVEVRLDGTPIAGKRLTNEDGVNHDSLKVNVPETLVKPDSKMQVVFNLSPKEVKDCGPLTDQQLWGTVHADTQFDLKREVSVTLPDLALLQAGYPFTAPQDLSSTAIALPATPSDTELKTLLQVSERLGRVSQSDGLKLQVYTANNLSDEVRKDKNLIGIGTRDRLPFPEALQNSGFQLGGWFTRKSAQSQIQTLPDAGGVIKEVISPWNGNRALLALSAQSDAGLDNVRDFFKKDTLFFQLKQDTVLVNATQQNPSEYDPNAYALEFFEQAPRTRRIEQLSLFGQGSRFLQDNWYLLPTGIVLSALVLYGVVQLYLKRVALVKDK